MKKIIFSFLVIFLIITTSCINIFHFIEVKNNKDLNVQFKLTLSKNLLELASMKDEGSDFKNFLNMLDQYQNMVDPRTKAEFIKIDNEREKGFIFKYTTDGSKMGENNEFFPYYSQDKKTLIINFPKNDGSIEFSEDEADYIKIILEQAKYTLLLKSFSPIRDIKVMIGGMIVDNIKFSKLSEDLYIIEVPFILFFLNLENISVMIQF